MSGHVFHPGHHDLHGITVVLETDVELWVGRFDSVTPKGVLLHDAGCYEDGVTEGTREEYLRKTLKFGVRATTKNKLIPEDAVRGMRQLAEIAGHD
ncbi:MAG: hypothetical protein E4H41_05960 [Gemmatimonadales bacterium]|nr:MAG: hypothetical protein E4H41_05960 [Gemmatimonadales bacterium]